MKNSRSDRLMRCAAAILSFCMTFVLLYALYWMKELVPFGEKTLMIDDANWQYIDFFAYLKDVIAGKNSITYTFSKGIGGSALALFAYYLSSPLNLLVALFKKHDLHVFFALLYAVKISLAAAFFNGFLSARFFRARFEFRHLVLTVLLAASYALGQYSISQASNIMWLDGVYMLPLIMLGAWNVARGGRIWKLAVPVGLSILFNWYSAGSNCVFSAFYFLFELFVEMWDSDRRRDWRYALNALLRYGVAMFVGVLISACLFLPTVTSLSGTSKGSFNLGELTDFTLNGNPLNTVRGFVPGSASREGLVALCCGTLALLGCVSLFRLKSLPRWRKNAYITLAVTGLAMFYLRPLVLLFSLLKWFDSYWYRYSHVGIAIVVYLAAAFFSDGGSTAREKASTLLKSLPLVLVAWLVASYIQRDVLAPLNRALRWYVLAGLSVALFLRYLDRGRMLRLASAAMCVVFVMGDIAFNAALLMADFSDEFVEEYKVYGAANRRQISALQAADSGPYRVVQTNTRKMLNQNTAMYNEPMGNDYWSIVIYASTVDEPQMQFLDRLGYPEWASTLNVANHCQLAADSLLSVKYVLSTYRINGLVRTDLEQGIPGKHTYENPYCLPFAFRYTESGRDDEWENPFEYQNAIYSRLLGEETRLYFPLTCSCEVNEEEELPIRYTIDIPQGEYAIYGNLPSEEQYDGFLNLNGLGVCYYAQWFCPDVFYIPTQLGDTSAWVSIKTKNLKKVDFGNEQFYALDLKELKRVTDALSARAAEKICVENGFAEFTATAAGDGERLYISIPCDAGWTITRNGETMEIDPEADVFEDCLYAIPLQAGENTIRMTYRVPRLKLYVGVSVFGVLLLAALELWHTRTERKRVAGKRSRAARE